MPTMNLMRAFVAIASRPVCACPDVREYSVHFVELLDRADSPLYSMCAYLINVVEVRRRAPTG